MKHIDTPAGKFQILINGASAEFEAHPHCPYAYHDKNGIPVPILACYEISLFIQGLSIGDIIEAQFDYGTLSCDGGGEGMDNAVGFIGDYAVAIGATDTEHFEWDTNQRELPYENDGLNGPGFTFRIVDDPKKYTARPIQQKISFVIAWESNDKDYAWDIVSFMTS